MSTTTITDFEPLPGGDRDRVRRAGPVPVCVSGASNVAAGFLSTARQQIGGAQGDGKLSNSMVVARGSFNAAGGFQSTAAQRIGVAE